MKTLVTGGTGFIGSHLVDALVSKDEDIRCLVRKTSNVSYLRKLKVELVYGDVTDKVSLREAVKDVDIVYHLVGIGDVSAISDSAYKKYRKTNVLGTKNLIDECLLGNINKFIYFSSIAAIGVITDVTIDETTPCNPVTPYERSKYESEKIVLKYWKENGLPATIIRPSMVYGEGDMKSNMFRICKMIRKHIFPIIGSGNNLMGLTHVSNVVQGAVLAGEKKRSVGEIYIISDEKSYALNKVIQTIAKAEGIKHPGIHVPVTLANIGGLIFEIISKITGITPPLTRKRIKSMTSNRIYSIAKARKELGYKPINLDYGIKRTIEWYKINNYL